MKNFYKSILLAIILTVAAMGVHAQTWAWGENLSATTGKNLTAKSTKMTNDYSVSSKVQKSGLRDESDFVPVTDIIRVETPIIVNQEFSLWGEVLPGDAYNVFIKWSVKDAGNTGAIITYDDLIKTSSTGTVIITATVEDGLAIGTDYTKDFVIDVVEGHYETGGNVYAYFYEALDEAAEGGTIKLLHDFTAGNNHPIYAYNVDKNITIDLDGHTFHFVGDERAVDISTESTGTVKIQNGTIKSDGWSECINVHSGAAVLDNLTAISVNGGIAVVVVNEGTNVSILSGDYYGAAAAVYVDFGSTVTITSGHFSSNGGSYYGTSIGCLATFEDGGEILLASGSVSDVNPWLNIPQVLDVTISASGGCTPVYGIDTKNSCNSYTWINGVTYTTSTNNALYTIQGGASNGCDSIVNLHLTINTPKYGTETITACNSYTWTNGVTYTTSTNNALYTISNGASNGCDSIVNLHLTIVSAINFNIYDTICSDQLPYTEYGFDITETGHYYLGTWENLGDGCDTIVNLYVTVNDCNCTPVYVTQNYTACNSFVWLDGITYTSNNNTATYTIVGGAANGCDSVITLHLTIANTAYGIDTQVANNSYTWINGVTYTSSNGNDTHIIQGGSSNGCDSIVTLNLTINKINISGNVMLVNQTPLTDGTVELYLINDSTSTITHISTVLLDNGGHYQFDYVENGSYLIKAKPQNSADGFHTYYESAEQWQDALSVNITNASVSGIDIIIVPCPVIMDGNGTINGYVVEEADNVLGAPAKNVVRESQGDNPVPDVSVYLQRRQNEIWSMVAQTVTNEIGFFEFTNVPAGEYRVILDIPGFDMTDPPVIELGEGETVENIDYTVTEEGIINTPTGITTPEEELGIVFYPNPVKDELRITNYELRNENYSIFNVSGQVLMQGALSGETTTVNVKSLPSGIYFIKAGDKTSKFVKE